MLAATYTQGAQFLVQEVPEPVLSPGDLLLRVQAASLCATDLKIIRHGHRKLRTGQRIVLGHEFCGEIVATGGATGTFRPGLRVGVAPNLGCGTCDACMQGRFNYCPDYSAFGITFDGAHAPLVRVPAAYLRQNNVVPLPESLAACDAALLEPLSCVVAGVRTAGILLGETVVIYGAGPMGLLHVLLVRLSGATRVIVIDPLERRLKKARELGADDALNPAQTNIKKTVLELTEGRGVQVAIVTCPVAEAQTEALGLLAPFGRLCLFSGLAAGVAAGVFDTNTVHRFNLTVTGTTGGAVQDYRTALRLVASHRVVLKPLIADTFPMTELERAYQRAQSGVDGKVVLVA